jgi:hypothetical protein
MGARGGGGRDEEKAHEAVGVVKAKDQIVPWPYSTLQ